MNSFNTKRPLTDATDGPKAVRHSAAVKGLAETTTAIEDTESEKRRVGQHWRDFRESLTGLISESIQPSIDATLLPYIRTLWAAVVFQIVLELLCAAALAVLLLNLPPVGAVAVGCLLALAYALIAKAVITGTCVVPERPIRSLQRTKLAAIASGTAALLAIAAFLVVRIGTDDPALVNASLTALNIFLPISAAAMSVHAWTVSAPNRLASTFLGLERELRQLKSAQTQLAKIESETAPEPSSPHRSAIDSAGDPPSDTDALDRRTNGHDRAAPAGSLPVLAVLFVTVAGLGFGAADAAAACDDNSIRHVRIAVDKTGSIAPAEGARVMAALRKELSSLNETLPCAESISAFGWSGGWSADGDMAVAQLPSPPDLDDVPAEFSGSEASLLFKSARRDLDKKIGEWRFEQAEEYRSELAKALEPVTGFLDTFDWSVARDQTCLYQQLVSLSYEPGDSLIVVLTDGYQQNCGFRLPAGETWSGANALIVLVLLPNKSDDDRVLHNVIERGKTIHSIFPDIEVVTWLSLNPNRPGWLRNIVSRPAPECNSTAEPNADGRCATLAHNADVISGN